MPLSHGQQIHVGTILNVQAVEDELTELWAENANDKDDDGAIVRARVLNLLAYVTDKTILKQTDEIVFDTASVHPCRAILLFGEKDEEAKDIEAFVSARCHLGGSGKHHLCIEQITMRASGEFVEELPSAALPLLVPDLHSFLWWRGDLNFDDKVFKTLSRSVDRIVIDTAEMKDVENGMIKLSEVFTRKDTAAISDLNWARLTEWRSVIASVFDSPENRKLLDEVTCFEIASSTLYNETNSKAVLLAGWLASRLGWRVVCKDKDEFVFERNGKKIIVFFMRANREKYLGEDVLSIKIDSKQGGKFAWVSIRLDETKGHYEVGVYGIENQTNIFSYKKVSDANLLINELNLLHNDKSYEKAVTTAKEMFQTAVFE